MPGWYIHMDAARKALAGLAANAGAAQIFGQDQPAASDLSSLAQSQPAYAALGAIGPDIFFLLPDFKPPAGYLLWGAANTIRDLYTAFDDYFIGPYEDNLQPQLQYGQEELNSLTGGVLDQANQISSTTMTFLRDAVMVFAVRQYDVFSFLGSGVQSAYDEQTFFWSDMLHYRKTYEFARYLWESASTFNPAGGALDQVTIDRRKAFALGWMSHLATDVAGHCFVNHKSGGPYRLHWQRHHLVENHMDAKVYDAEHGTQPKYQMLSCAALHLWIAFEDDASSHANFFAAQPGPDYSDGDDTDAFQNRKNAWDVDSDMPDDLAEFLANALTAVYPEFNPQKPDPLGQCAAHPTIIATLAPPSKGYPDAAAIKVTYWWLYKYLKMTTTDYFKLRRPPAPNPLAIPDFPQPPQTGPSDPGPTGSDDPLKDTVNLILDILKWLAYIADVSVRALSAAGGAVAGVLSYPARDFMYEHVEIPLYNAWMALHWYLSMTGFNYPMREEMNPGLHTLGLAPGDVWGAVQAALADPLGGLKVPPVQATEPSGRSGSEDGYPRDEVADPPNAIAIAIDAARQLKCNATGDTPSEYLRPWRWPDRDNDNFLVPPEYPPSVASPFHAPQDATALMGGAPGDDAARKSFEACRNETETIATAHAQIAQGKHLGDPVDYSGYVMAQLTRPAPAQPITNFNLDSDRGYGYLCWDWVRSDTVTATPISFMGMPDQHTYQAPLRPGSGWCNADITNPQQQLANLTPDATPLMHVPSNNGAPGQPVRIRYIDREAKFPPSPRPPWLDKTKLPLGGK
jgi:hypothetical protein